MSSLRLPDGTPLTVRPLRPDDLPRYREIVERLSSETVTNRFLGPRPPLTEAEMRDMLDVGHDGREALAVIDAGGGIVAVGRLGPTRGDPPAAEVALVVSDDWQRRGVGTGLLDRLLDAAESIGYSTASASTLVGNRAIASVLSRAGFRAGDIGYGVVEWSLSLRDRPSAG